VTAGSAIIKVDIDRSQVAAMGPKGSKVIDEDRERLIGEK